MFIPVRSGRLFVIACVAVLFPLGCSQSLESNEQFQTQVSRLDRVDTDLTNALRSISRIDTEIQQVNKEVRALKEVLNAKGGVAGVPGDAVKSLEQRLIGLEAQLKKVTVNPPAAAAAPTAPAAAATAAAKPRNAAPAPSSGAAAKPERQVTGVAKATPKATPGKTVSAKVTRKATASRTAAAPVQPSGSYYNVKATDTLASIAEKNNISAESLLSANRLPPNVRLYAGQQLFIPRK